MTQSGIELVTFRFVAQCMIYIGHLLLTEQRSEDKIGWAGLADDFRESVQNVQENYVGVLITP